MPLSMVNVGETRLIRKIGGQTETKQFLEKLGFVVGGEIKVVSVMGGNLIVQVKEARVAISKEMALKIMVSGEMKDENTEGHENRRNSSC